MNVLRWHETENVREREVDGEERCEDQPCLVVACLGFSRGRICLVLTHAWPSHLIFISYQLTFTSFIYANFCLILLHKCSRISCH